MLPSSRRVAPEYAFSTAVEDGIWALLHLSASAANLGIDADRMLLSGFSAGGYLAFTVSLPYPYIGTNALSRCSNSYISFLHYHARSPS